MVQGIMELQNIKRTVNISSMLCILKKTYIFKITVLELPRG